VLLVLVPLLYLVVRQRPEDMGLRVDGGSLAEADTAEIPIRHAFALFARSRAFWGAALLFGAMAGVLISVNLHMFLNYTGLGLGDYRAALILSVTGGSMLVSKPLFGWLIDRLGARRSTMLALLTAAVTMTAYCFADSFLPLLLAGVLLGVSFGGIVPLQAALLSRLFDTRLFGRAYGALRLSIFPMTVTFTPLTGLTYDLTGSYAPAFAAFAALFVVVALVTPRMIRLDPGRRQ
jgi:MFS family permease